MVQFALSLGHRIVGVVTIVVMLLSLEAAGAVGAASPRAAMQSVTYGGVDYGFRGPDKIQSGLVSVTFVNQGDEPHQLQFARIHNGKTFNDLLAALKKSPEAAFPLLDFPGGVNAIEPHASQTAVLDLKPGTYALLCFVSGPDNIPHLAKGMIKEVTVEAASTGARAPATDGMIMLKDFRIAVPATVTAGHHVWKVYNQGPQPHEMTLLKLAPGKTMADVGQYFQKPSGPPPFSAAGGMGGMSAGMSAYLSLDLTEGSYIALCFIPDAASGKPHFALGMITPFSVVVKGVPVPVTMPNTGAGGSILPWLLAGFAVVACAGGIALRRRVRG